MKLSDLTGRRVALLGLGIDVRASVPAIVAAGPSDLAVVDSATNGPTVEVEGHSLAVDELSRACVEAEIIVRSPGFPRYLPELVSAREHGVAMTTPIDLFVSGLRSDQTVVMVTGTKGKSTTTDLIGRFCEQAGIRTGVAGNLGIPVFDDGWDSDAPVIVLEVSSYQASDLHAVPTIAVVTSIAEDHLSWHGGVDQYLRDKLRIVENDGGTATTVMVPAGETRAREVLGELFPDIIPVTVDDIEGDESIPHHRLRNAALAAAVVERLGVKLGRSEIQLGAASSMPGRLDRCPASNDFSTVRFMDDTLASNPSATAAGLRWARSLGIDTVVILGGDDRGVNPAPLIEEVAHWHGGQGPRLRAVTLAHNGPDLAQRCGIEIVGHAGTVSEAVALAAGVLAEVADRSESMVLFSPAAPTPVGSGNWKSRSDEFRSAVLKLSHP